MFLAEVSAEARVKPWQLPSRSSAVSNIVRPKLNLGFPSSTPSHVIVERGPPFTGVYKLPSFSSRFLHSPRHLLAQTGL